MSLTKCCIRTLGAGALALLVPGCGLPPCVEGTIRIEVLELQPSSTCLWELWPAGATITAKTTGSRGNSDDRCVIQNLEYIAPSDEPQAGGAIVQGGAPVLGVPISFLPPMHYEFDDCFLSVSGELTMDRQYADFDEAFAAQQAGAPNSFFVQMGYAGEGACSSHPFGSRIAGNSASCGNTYRARVTQL